ncbi:hypothetical protein [Bosea sp. (in: a-proteobacteria)]|jgi:hypothetical protein|uniref:hypothetical protein n=1 Tax=Bosea sp. (in: a-proteobacteria) TaxID=1871050 RepID=UPI002B49C013|nr:hypothetical protein [Bosea sp. (in: a-proteobacteria)]WRH56134.1 MAG: hypothetical protein RSE11_13850 [Bosea sp. (in: a-proteobacteria)]
MPSWLSWLRHYLATSAIGHLLWEIAQLPLYTIWSTETVREQVIAIVHCTAGDVVIATLAIVLALVLVGDSDWPANSFWPPAAAALMGGFAYTGFSEWLNTVFRTTWSYSEWMPVLDLLGFRLGLSPMLQWVVVPALAMWLAMRAGLSSRLTTLDPRSRAA